MTGSLDKSTGVLAFRSQERDALRLALHDHLIVGAVFDLNYCDDSILEIIGQTQKACSKSPLICISGRQLTGHTLSQRNRTFYYVHPKVPPLALRKMLQQPPVPESMPFQGVLQTRSLPEMVQLLLFACLSGRLTVWSGSQSGELHVHRGQIVHADVGGRQGYAAALSLLEWPRGSFRFQQSRPSAQTMQLGPHHPLFDPSRRTPSGEGVAVTRSELSGSMDIKIPTPSGGVSTLSPRLELSASSANSQRSVLPMDQVVSHRSPTSATSAVSHRSPPSAASMISHRSPLSASSTISQRSSASALETTGSMQRPSDSSGPTQMPGDSSGPTQMPGDSSGPNVVSDSILEYLWNPRSESAELAARNGAASTPIPPNEEPGLDQSIKQSWLELDAEEMLEPTPQEDPMAVTASSVKDILSKLELTIEGFIGAAVADSDSGMCIGSTGGAGILNVEVAAAANTEVVRAKRKAMKSLNLRDEIEDILITLGKHYHLIRPLRARPQLFMYLAVDRSRANLAMARFALADAERDLGV